METIEGNKLIAEFMGATAHKHGIFEAVNFPESTKDGFKSYDLIYLQYHSSWDWLMPVVEKIESMKLGLLLKNGDEQEYENQFYIERNCAWVIRSNDGCNLIGPIIGKTKINSVWATCIEFIQWYNKVKK